MVGRGGGRLGAEPRVRGVDHHPAGVVFQQVEAAGPRGGESDTRRFHSFRGPAFFAVLGRMANLLYRLP
jgi:hypothetical protein